jgi:pimeloyl-ACP methyl ester carboxylesterase
MNRYLFLLLIGTVFVNPVFAQKRRPDPGPQPKNIHGLVQDIRGTPLPGARVFVRDVKSNVTRTATADPKGLYAFYALPPTADYEVYADFRGKSSEKKVISSFLNRADNVINFQLDLAVIGGAEPDSSFKEGPALRTYDSVDLRGSFDLPTGASAPIRAVLLLHGYGEDRSVWNDLKKELLGRGWAVMTIDLRGHGQSKTRNGRPFEASPEWRASSQEFPFDLDPALDWLKSQPRIDSGRIVVIGSDIGANLALIASGRFPEVRTVVAINPRLDESLSMAGSALDFAPRSALIVMNDTVESDRLKAGVRLPVRILTGATSGGTLKIVAEKQIQDGIFQWLRETF